MSATAAVLAVVLSQAAPTAPEPVAPEPRPASPVSLSLGAGTDFPLSVHAAALLELPGRVQLSTSVGRMPRSYLETLDDVLVRTGAYGRDDAQLVEDSLSSAVVWRTFLGWRPFPHRGFYFAGGYTLITLGGNVTSTRTLFRALGIDVPPDLLDEVALARVHSTLHQGALELGWQWTLPARLKLKLGLGGFTTFAASSSLEAEVSEPFATLAQPLLNTAEGALNDTYTGHVHGAYASLALYFTLF
ncbi:hypothetical protein FGE12_29510 [Aggregicoccus sp. 17bor-14]|uniref:hypothetical protein n=1 Tax=Myxococcaceae TaxID=31 RepID=UPI00129CBB3D|nr:MULTISPECIES: hypothetical protein [Myxococcaceae]MBF5046591.1 hypothetical protein [Simulacricoccus sp. 17bor-14]MRI92302.1 hypothetical protein [Aggregicoccus sp. 17bor-14]